MPRDRRSYDPSNSGRYTAFGEDIPQSVFLPPSRQDLPLCIHPNPYLSELTYGFSYQQQRPSHSFGSHLQHTLQPERYLLNPLSGTAETEPSRQPLHFPLTEAVHQDDGVVASDDDETKLKKKIVRLETISGILSIACLITSFIFAADEGFNKYVRLTRSVIIYSRKPENKFALKTWVTQYNQYCPSHPQHLLEPAWETLNKESYDGVGSTQSVFASKLYIWPLAFTVFVFSAFFQLSRGFWYKQYFNPTEGPDYGRWLEYLVTSPLQVVLVAIAFGFSDRDQLLSWAGVQAALVILGYSIEKQIKKVYIRKIVADKKKKQELRRFYNIFVNFEIRDVRLFVYLALTWFLHFSIWGIPIINSVGIGSRYALQEDHNTSCEKDTEFKIPDFVLGLYWSQFICFTLFGVVATLQVFQAFYQPLNTTETTKHGVKTCPAYRQRWGWYSLAYAVLSVTCKTLLEVFFIGFIRMYSVWPIVQTPGFSVNSNNVQQRIPYRISTVKSLNTSVAQLNVKDFDTMCYLYPLKK